MFSKEKMTIGLLLVVFLGTASMFVYQNFISDKKSHIDMDYVYIAKENIVKGDKLTADNIGKMALPTENILPSYITSFEELENKVAKSSILQYEIISEGRIADEMTDETFSVIVTPKNKFEVEEGEAVNVYVQLTEDVENDDGKNREYHTYELARNKVVKKVIYNEKSSGMVERNIIEGIELHFNEDEAMAYYNADYLKDYKSKIIVIPYKDVLSESEGVSNSILEAKPFRTFLEKQK